MIWFLRAINLKVTVKNIELVQISKWRVMFFPSVEKHKRRRLPLRVCMQREVRGWPLWECSEHLQSRIFRLWAQWTMWTTRWIDCRLGLHIPVQMSRWVLSTSTDPGVVFRGFIKTKKFQRKSPKFKKTHQKFLFVEEVLNAASNLTKIWYHN